MLTTPHIGQTLMTDEMPPSATGQYPDPPWAKIDYSRVVEATAFGDGTSTPPSATGQYPDPPWANIDYSTLAETVAFASDLPVPPSATGQYPDPPWADIDYGPLAEMAAGGEMPTNPTPQNGSIGSLIPSSAAVTLDHQEMYQIIRAVAAGIAGDALYEWVDTSDAAQEGVRVGFVGFRQGRGELGALLQVMQRRDPSLFAVVMGQHADELIRITTATQHETRLQPVGGHPLWHEEWTARFRQAGQHPAFQAAQNETAIEEQLRPMLSAARELDLRSARGLAILYDRVVVLGLADATTWVRERLGGQGDERERLQILLQNAKLERLNQVYVNPLLDDTIYALE